MKLHLLTLAASASAYVVTDQLKAITHDVHESVDSLFAAGKLQANSLTSSLYDVALSLQPQEDEYLNIQGGQHAFDMFDHPHDGPHSPHPHPPGKDKPGKHPKHRNPHDQKDKSIYEFIAESEYFTTLHDIIKGDKHAVEELNKTSANLTLFAPTNKALEKYESHAPPVEYLRKILLYHLLPEVFPAGRVLRSKTLETLYIEDDIEQAQRLAVDINLRGVTLNYYARVIYIDIFTNNGVVHAIDNLLFPPPKIYDIAEVLPSSFSTFINAAWKTGLVETLNETEKSTIFAPSNFAFASLGARINAYLFSTRGQPVLTKLLKYHIVPNVLFYSDAFFGPEAHANGLVQHHELTPLQGSKINVDVSEWGRFKTIVFNGRSIGISDIPAKNGVLQKLRNGIILPYKNSLATTAVEDMTIEQFVSLFDDSEDMPPTAAAVSMISAGPRRTCRIMRPAAPALDSPKMGQLKPALDMSTLINIEKFRSTKSAISIVPMSADKVEAQRLLSLLNTEDMSSIEDEMFALL